MCARVYMLPMHSCSIIRISQSLCACAKSIFKIRRIRWQSDTHTHRSSNSRDHKSISILEFRTSANNTTCSRLNLLFFVRCNLAGLASVHLKCVYSNHFVRSFKRWCFFFIIYASCVGYTRSLFYLFLEFRIIAKKCKSTVRGQTNSTTRKRNFA